MPRIFSSGRRKPTLTSQKSSRKNKLKRQRRRRVPALPAISVGAQNPKKKPKKS